MMLDGVVGSICMEMVSIAGHYAMKNMQMAKKVVKMIVKLANMEMKGMGNILKFFFIFISLLFQGCVQNEEEHFDIHVLDPPEKIIEIAQKIQEESKFSISLYSCKVYVYRPRS